MNRIFGWMVLAATALVASVGTAAAQEPEAPSVEARIWLDRGEEPVVQRGDRVRVYYRTSADGYLAIFHIDTNGAVSLLFPASPEADHRVRGERDYRLLFPRSSSWFVDEDPGVGYFFILASPEPLDFRNFRYSWAADGWDLSFVGRTVYDDPFVAMDEYIAQLIPDWEYADYALDWVEYNVGERHDYPRFLCYDCHGFNTYSAWNPYLSACSSFRVVIYNDPWYYPVNRYRGRRVVYVRPPLRGQPRFVFKERGVGEPWSPIVQPRPSDGGRPGVPGSVAPRRSGSGIGSGGTAPPVSRPRVGTPGSVRFEPRTRPTRGRPVYTPSSTGVRGMPSSRPVTSGARGLPATRPGSTGNRPSSRGGPTVIRPGSSSAGATRSTSGGVEVIRGRTPGTGSAASGSTARSRPGAVRAPSSGGSAARSRPSSGGGASTAKPTRIPSRSAPSTSRTRNPTRSTPSTSRAPTPTRSLPTRARSGSSTRSLPSATRSRTPTRSIPTTTRSRAPTRSSGATRSRTPARSSAGSRRPPTRSAPARKPPVRRKPGGGG